MKHSTPLAEVVAHLPQELLVVLADKSPRVRDKALEALRQSITLMEEEGAVLDPVSYRAVVFSMGVIAITAAEWGEALAQIETVVQKVKGRP